MLGAMRGLGLVLVGFAVMGFLTEEAWGQRRKKEDEEPKTQVLELPKELPNSITGATANLRFYVSPLSNKGLLTAQLKEALKQIVRQAKGGQILRLRALVAGTGDLRRVATVVSEELTERRQALPVLTTVQVSGLPLTGAQVQLEAVVQERKAVSPNGLVLFAGQQVLGKQEGASGTELLRQSLENLAKTMNTAGVDRTGMQQITCYVHTLDGSAEMLLEMSKLAPQAALTLAQLVRASATGVAECEGIGRPAQKPAKALQTGFGAGLERSENYSHYAAFGSEKLVFTTGRLGFGDGESEVKQVFERLRKDLEAGGTGYLEVGMTRIYPLYPAIFNRVREVRFQFLNKQAPPASTALLFDGLPGTDAQWSMDLVAAGQ